MPGRCRSPTMIRPPGRAKRRTLAIYRSTPMTAVATLDHITVAALTLEQGIAHVRATLGVDVPFGGAHPLMATHNCLMQIGDGVFLEIIAPDPAATPQRARWFALDDP